jgi:GT2 family glycosyltransferase
MSGAAQPQVVIVILHWKAYLQTRRLLQSLALLAYPNYRVILVDNKSNDGSAERLQSEFPQHEFIFNDENEGFSRGCNRGIRAAFAASADYVLLLNNDMEVEADFLQAAVSVAEEDPSVGLVTGKILFGDRRSTIWQAGGRIDRLRIQGIPRGWNEVDQGQYDDICDTGWASGAMLLIPRRVFEKVGLLPEEYFFGIEEWEYSTSVKHNGFRIVYVPEFRSYHYAGGSYRAGHPVLIVYNGFRNKLIYAQKHLSGAEWLVWKLIFRCYLTFWWPRKGRAGWGCHNEQDYHARLKAARLALSDHHGINRVELSDLERAANQIGPTPTWSAGWGPVASQITE